MLCMVSTCRESPYLQRSKHQLQKNVKKLTIDLERPLNDLLEEALQDLLKKYQKRKAKQ